MHESKEGSYFKLEEEMTTVLGTTPIHVGSVLYIVDDPYINHSLAVDIPLLRLVSADNVEKRDDESIGVAQPVVDRAEFYSNAVEVDAPE